MGGMSVVLLFSSRNRILASLIIMLITGILATGLPQLRLDTRLDLLLDREGTKYQHYLEAMETFGSDDTTVFFIRDAALFTPEKLEILQAMGDDIDALDSVERVDSLFSLTSIRNRDDWLESKIVLDVLPDSQAEADQVLEDALYSPLLRGNVVGEDGDVMAFTVTIRHSTGSEENLDDETQRTNQEFEKIVDQYSMHFDDLFHAGNSRVGNELRDYLIRDIFTLGPISIVVLLLTVGLLLRSAMMGMLPVFTSVLSTIWTLGFMGHVDIPLNLLTAMLPALLLVIGATEDIHLSSAFIEAYDKDEATDRGGAIQYMANHMATAVVITTFTTSVGFVSNVLSNLEIIQHFAIIASFGIMANAVATFLSVPMLLSLLGPVQGEKHANEDKRETSSVLRLIADFCVKYLHESTYRHPTLVLAITSILIVLSGLSLLNISVNTDPMTFFPEDSEIIEHTNRITENLGGVLIFFVTIDAHEPDAFLEPENLDRLNRLVRKINDEGIFDRAMAHTEHLSLVNQEMHGGDASYYHPPENRDLVEQYLMFFQRSDIESYVSSDASSANVIVRYSIYGSEQALDEVAKLEVIAKQILGPGMTVNIVGKYTLINDASRQLVANEAKAMSVIICVIFVVMWLFYGSIRAGLISLMPNMIPILFTFSIMVLVGIEVNPATAMVASIVIGIAIDDTTHLLTRFNTECRKSDDMNKVIHNVIQAEAIPIVVSSLALGAGFLVLTASQFTITREFGFLAAIAMILALLTEFIVTPLLLRNLWAVNIWDVLSLKLPMDLLRKAPLFAGMSRFQIKKLVLLTRERLCFAGEFVTSEGDLGDEMYVVISGKISLHYENSGEHPEVVTCGIGDVVGEIGFVGDVIRTAKVKVEQDAQLLVLDHRLITHRLRRYPYIAAKLNKNMAQLLGHRNADTSVLQT